jgi:hypothetical protein
MSFKVVVVFDVEASCYAAALDKVYHWRANINEALSPVDPVMSRVMFSGEELLPEGTEKVQVVNDFEHDNSGQRVLYLPNEDEDSNAKD